jgi:DNA-binding transcriptional regulator YiaG
MSDGSLRYTGCGLENVFLRNGFQVYSGKDGEERILIQDLEGLHKAIAAAIANSPAPLDAKTFRFLRRERDMSQRQIAAILGVEEQTVSGWERARHPIPQSADLVLKGLTNECINGNAELGRLIDRFNSLDRDMRALEAIELAQADGHWNLMQAA